MTYEYDAIVVRVIDGDTVVLKLSKEFDFGFFVRDTKTYEGHFRLINVNAPEIFGTNACEEGRIAKEKLTEWLNGAHRLKATTYKPDKYGRWLCELFVVNDDLSVVNLNEKLISEGFAKRYV